MRFVLLLALLFISACTKFEIGYQLAPRWVSNRLDDAFDFSSARLKEIRSQLNEDFKKNHRAVAELVTKHADELLALAEKKEVLPKDCKNIVDSIYQSRKDLLILFKPSVDMVLKNLSVAESKKLNEYSEKKFKESDEKLAEKEDYIKKQLKTFDKIMDFLFDSASNEQTKMYENFVIKNFDYYVVQEESRKTFLKKFNVLLQDKNELVDFVIKYYASDISVQSDNYQKKHAVFLNSLYDFKAKIWHSCSDKQKKAFTKNLLALKEEVAPFNK